MATQRDDGNSTPIEPPDDRAPAEVVEYPGPVMETLDAGTYLLQPSWEDTAPRARLDLPAGWNAWQGPNRFDGDLDTTTWYAGLLVVEVDAVASKACDPQVEGRLCRRQPGELVDALRRAPGFHVRRRGADRDVRLSRHAPPDGSTPESPASAGRRTMSSTTNSTGSSPGGSDSLTDVWVIDLDGNALLVAAGYSTKTPPEIQQELSEMVDSIEFVDPE